MGPAVRNRDHKQMIAVGKMGRSIVLSGDDGRRKTGMRGG
jgi:hypothetical protein